jgi:NAD(P)-dependent dehydrogenase (short-subunit alcohol dehydrogenase family)
MGLLDGKVAIVTGAGHGIGRGHALELAKEGAKVVVNDLGTSLKGEGEGKDADLTVELIQQRGGEAVANYANVTDGEAVAAMVDQAVTEFGRLDIVVNNAGIARDATIWNMTEDDWDSVIAVHLKGTFLPTQAAIKHWRERSKAGDDVSSGRIINTTSGAGLTGNFGQANYTAAKMGIAAFTMTVSLEVFKLGVTVNCIGPAGARGVGPDGPVAQLAPRRLAGERQGRPRDRPDHPRGQGRDRPDAAVEQRSLHSQERQALGPVGAHRADERRPVPLPRPRPALLTHC